jgi:hypothetical protein
VDRVHRPIVATLCALLVAGALLSAHTQYRIIGAVTKVTATSLEVRQAKDGKIISMEMDGESMVMRDEIKVRRAEIKVGLQVVVDACGDSLKDLLVMAVRIVPAPPKR